MAREHQLKTVGCADPAPQTLQRLVTRVRCAWTWERTVGVVLIIAGLILALPAAAQERRFTAEDLARAVVRAGEPVRAWGDDPAGFCRLVGSGAAGPERAWLSLSGGGEDGAFGAGVLVGWTRSSQRRDYDLVTGVSAGALMAPYAFLGRGFDDALRAMYAGSSAAEVFEVGYTGPDALLDTWPLARSIGLHVTPGLVALIAEEHRRGRRLLVVTTNLDAERPVVWSLGALAQGDPGKAAVLIQSVLLASASIPGLFPPVRVESRRPDGSSLIELHGDGSASAPFFLLPEPVLGGHGRKAQGAGSSPQVAPTS